MRSGPDRVLSLLPQQDGRSMDGWPKALTLSSPSFHLLSNSTRRLGSAAAVPQIWSPRRGDVSGFPGSLQA